jgi:hypothetical protein
MAPSIITCNQETPYHDLHLAPSPTPLNLTFLSLLFHNNVLFNYEPMNVHPLGISTHAFNYLYHDHTYHIERPIRIKFKPICYLHPLYPIPLSPFRVAEVDPPSQCLIGFNILGIGLIGLGPEERFAIISPDSSSFEILIRFFYVSASNVQRNTLFIGDCDGPYKVVHHCDIFNQCPS